MDGRSLSKRWGTLYGKALEMDKWGQIEEAQELYEQLAMMIDEESKDTSKKYSADNLGVMAKVVICLRMRANGLKNGDVDSVDIAKMSSLVEVFDSLFREAKIAFPFEMSKFADIDIQTASAPPPSSTKEEMVIQTPAAAVSNPPLQSASSSGRLLPPPPFSEGMTFFDILIERIGFKDETIYIDPFISITVVDALGNAVETSQETGISNSRKRNYINFNTTVHLQTAESALPPECAVFFEFKHFKPKKKKKSTKCFAFIERDELKPGPVSCELYLKPTDFSRRKKLHLMTIKPLYLHLQIIQRKD